MTASSNNPDPLQQSTLRTLQVEGREYHYYSLVSLQEGNFPEVRRLPVSLKILLENLLRYPGVQGAKQDVRAMVDWLKTGRSNHEVGFRPTRVLMQDFTGVPAVVDLAAMRDAVAKKGGDPARVNPVHPVDLVIDHSVMVDHYANISAYADNVAIEMQRNRERYEFLRWGQQAFDNFRVVPPGTGICHQVNLEYLAKTVWSEEVDGKLFAFPDSLVGTDSHTTMINALAVLGWGVGGIEAEAAMLGQPLSMLIPEVVGVHVQGSLAEGITATDLVLTVAEALRQHGVVGKFVEFHGPGLTQLSLADRATISNMSPEYGATCTFFPVDDETLKYLTLSNRPQETISLVEKYSKEQGLWRDETVATVYSSTLELDLSAVQACLAGPKRPQDRVPLASLPASHAELWTRKGKRRTQVRDAGYSLADGDVVIAAITSCTNTSNPAVMMAAGLLARNAVAKGLRVKPWVKTSLAPGSKVVTRYLEKAGLQAALDELGFNLVGYGCTTCIGNSGPLPEAIAEAIDTSDLTVSSVLSGNRNFEGRIHPRVKANWLGSPPLVVAFALAGTTDIDITVAALGEDAQGKPVYLRDIWPKTADIQQAMAQVDKQMFATEYANVFSGNKQWDEMPVGKDKTYTWDDKSTYIRNPPFFSEHLASAPEDICDARVLALLGDSVTTDHISPAGAIARNSSAAEYLREQGVDEQEFNSYGSRRGNHEVMMRGTFANVRIRNEMLPGVEGGLTRLLPQDEQMSIYTAAMRYQDEHIPLVIIAGKEYGTGSSRDWAAKGTRLLGIRAVIAESFERIHRSNLAGMGVLPLQFETGTGRASLGLDGTELISIAGLSELKTGMKLEMKITRSNGEEIRCPLLCRLDTVEELASFNSGGIMPYVMEKLIE
ncbi:MAG: aconitate hydratase AcnA [Pseudomonadales bacterium]|nr:aconitate hydratase AcnA [Pseudomonadales bacterium]